MSSPFIYLVLLCILCAIYYTEAEISCGNRLQPTAPYRKPTYGSQCTAKVKTPPTRCLSDVAKELYAVSQKEVLDRHNCWRAQVNPPAKPALRNLLWDDELAKIAERWAAQCRSSKTNYPPLGTLGTTHDNSESRTLPNRTTNGVKWNWVGQNIAMSSANMTFSEAIDLWAQEQKDFKYGTGSINGNVVGHYTQVVASRTYYVGCGKAYCPKLSMPFLLVCNYGPGGNMKEAKGLDGTIMPYPSTGVTVATTTPVPTTKKAVPQLGGTVALQGQCKNDTDCAGAVGLVVCDIWDPYRNIGMCWCCSNCTAYLPSKGANPVCIKTVTCQSNSDCDSDQFCCPYQHLCFPRN